MGLERQRSKEGGLSSPEAALERGGHALQGEWMPDSDLETRLLSLLEQVEGALDTAGRGSYCEHCPMWGECSVCGSDHPRYLLLKTKSASCP